MELSLFCYQPPAAVSLNTRPPIDDPCFGRRLAGADWLIDHHRTVGSAGNCVPAGVCEEL